MLGLVAGTWAFVLLFFLVAVGALVLVFVGTRRSVRAFGFFNGRVFSRPAAPWTLVGLGLLLLDGLAMVAWLLTIPG